LRKTESPAKIYLLSGFSYCATVGLFAELSIEGVKIMPAVAMNIAHAYKLTGSHPEAWVLQHLNYFSTKTTKRTDHWIVRTVREFVEEHGFPFHPEVIRRAIKSLVKKGFLLLKHAPHPFKGGILRASWLRLNPNTELGLNTTEEWDYSQPETGTPIVAEETAEEVQKSLMVEPEGTTDKGISLKGISAADLKKKFAPKKPKSGTPLKPKSMFQLLKALQSEHVPGHPLGDSSGANLGRCKTILARMRELKMSDSRIEQTYTHLFSRWFEFRTYAQQVGGMKSLQMYPTMAQLTVTTTLAVSFLDQKHEQPAPSELPAEGTGEITDF
jgi:hypothetical protein